jgi:hypothetical protein
MSPTGVGMAVSWLDRNSMHTHKITLISGVLPLAQVHVLKKRHATWACFKALLNRVKSRKNYTLFNLDGVLEFTAKR